MEESDNNSPESDPSVVNDSTTENGKVPENSELKESHMDFEAMQSMIRQMFTAQHEALRTQVENQNLRFEQILMNQREELETKINEVKVSVPNSEFKKRAPNRSSFLLPFTPIANDETENSTLAGKNFVTRRTAKFNPTPSPAHSEVSNVFFASINQSKRRSSIFGKKKERN